MNSVDMNGSSVSPIAVFTGVLQNNFENLRKTYRKTSVMKFYFVSGVSEIVKLKYLDINIVPIR